MSSYLTIDSPIGPLQLVAENSALVRIAFSVEQGRVNTEDNALLLDRAASQLAEYFSGERQVFDLPLFPSGTDFQREVWAALAAIPWGETRSYADIARAVGRPKAVRAIGAANGRNPLPVVLPCHRVLGSDRSLTGYAGGLERKRCLLELEGWTDSFSKSFSKSAGR